MNFDLHVHTHFSHDAINNPRNVVKFFAKTSMGFAVTDHDTCRAWPLLHRYAKALDVPFIPGEEIRVYDDSTYLGELLGYFMNEPVSPGQYADVLDSLQQQAALISVPHPFDLLRSPRFAKPLFANPAVNRFLLARVHALETFNSRCLLSSFNQKAERIALREKLAVTGGSDAHTPGELGKACTVIAGNSPDDLRRALLKRETRVAGTRSSPFVHVLSTMAKHTDFLNDAEHYHDQ